MLQGGDKANNEVKESWEKKIRRKKRQVPAELKLEATQNYIGEATKFILFFQKPRFCPLIWYGTVSDALTSLSLSGLGCYEMFPTKPQVLTCATMNSHFGFFPLYSDKCNPSWCKCYVFLVLRRYIFFKKKALESWLNMGMLFLWEMLFEIYLYKLNCCSTCNHVNNVLWHYLEPMHTFCLHTMHSVCL